MFGMYQQLRSLLLGTEEKADDSNKSASTQPLGVASKPPIVEKQERYFTGVVSSVSDKSGMIDHQVFFELGCVIGGLKPVVGSSVYVHAEREHSQAGWQAKRVELTTKWRPEAKSSKQIMIGYVSKLSRTRGVVDCGTEEIAFVPPECISSRYRPHVNDWVQVTLLHQDEQTVVSGVCPLRERSVTGTVDSVSHGFGIINGDIYFMFSACVRGWRVGVGERVRVVCVEYRHHKSNWRAIHVEPIQDQPEIATRSFSPLPLSAPSHLSPSQPSLLEDKGGVTITDNGDFGVVEIGEQSTITMTISNHGDAGRVLLSCKPLIRDDQLLVILPSAVEVGHAESLEVVLKLETRTLGQLNTLLIFDFGEMRIARCVRANVVDPQLQFLDPVAPYQRGQQGGPGKIPPWERGGRYQAKIAACRVPGERPVRSSPLRLPHRLKQYPIPDDLRACFEDGEDVVSIRPQLGEPLYMENCSSRFSALLYLEELSREENMRQFDMSSASMRCCGPYLNLAVLGLAEGRPSLLVGDKVIVCEPGGDENSTHWEGFIHEVRGEDILIKFAEEFHEDFHNEDYDVMFTFNRTPLRRMHHAVEITHLIGPKALFPGYPSPKPPLLMFKSPGPIPDQQFFNPVLNSRQRAAVSRILGAQARPAPYVLFGPPGTGKTVTLVEAILQIHTLSGDSRILACAPSNSATDLIAERLHQSGQVHPGEMVRLNAVQRLAPPHPSILPYCMDTDSVYIAARSRIVIATCVSAGIIHGLGLGVGHFSHVFVDEAGQATEPECLIPVSYLAGSQGQLILAGDPQQLGPILSSSSAHSLGLGLSLLERLMNRPAYQRNKTKFTDHGNYDPFMVTKLVDNYRSHESILQLYSDAFYHGELQVKADPSVTHSLTQWELLPKKEFPLIFHGVLGEDMREGNSPSWFNPVEALQVVKYVQALKDNSTFAPKLSEIGIITPYRKQVEKIRLLLQRVGVEEVKVGSVEEFQGQERLAIIISTVRSTRDLVGFDLRHHLGFLSNPKRFNVAISRAQALLVVIGNPHLLCQDPHWSKLVQYAVDRGAYTGCPLPESAEDLELED